MAGTSYRNSSQKRKLRRDNLKILCISDHIDPLVYSERIKTRFKDIDIILGAGDLPINYYEYIISCLNKPLYFVFGNHNLKKMAEFKGGLHPSFSGGYDQAPSYGSTYIGGKVIRDRKNDLIIVGMGGSKRYSHQPNQFTEFGMVLRILPAVPKMIWYRIFRGRFCDILLTHTPPRGIHDREDLCHKGFKVFRLFLRLFSPRYMVHGHIHLYDNNEQRKSLFDRTEIYNAYDHIILEFDR